jgi:hypothetical protein
LPPWRFSPASRLNALQQVFTSERELELIGTLPATFSGASGHCGPQSPIGHYQNKRRLPSRFWPNPQSDRASVEDVLRRNCPDIFAYQVRANARMRNLSFTVNGDSCMGFFVSVAVNTVLLRRRESSNLLIRDEFFLSRGGLRITNLLARIDRSD